MTKRQKDKMTKRQKDKCRDRPEELSDETSWIKRHFQESLTIFIQKPRETKRANR